MSPAPRSPIGLALLLSLLLVLVGTAACSGGSSGPAADLQDPGPAAPDSEPAPSETDETDEPLAATPLPQRNVEIYYPSRQANGLVGEWHEIFATVTPGDRAKQIVNDLISGPTSSTATRAVPPGTRLRQAFVLESGTAYLDFSPELAEGIGGGSMAELLTVYAIVDSVVANVPEIHRVGILISGRTVESLNGHVDLRRPLPPDFSLVVSNTVRRIGDDEAGQRLASGSSGGSDRNG